MRFVTKDGAGAALEIWLEDRELPVIVRLVGVLDRSTGASVLSIVGDLILEGVRLFLIDTERVEIADAAGAAALALCQRRVREARGVFDWDGVEFGRRCPVDAATYVARMT
jgi:hypothetical protein